MKGLEIMLANLLGMKPEDMRAKVEQAVNLMEQGAKSAQTIQNDLAAIKAHLGIVEEPINGGRTAIANGGNSTDNHRIQL